MSNSWAEQVVTRVNEQLKTSFSEKVAQVDARRVLGEPAASSSNCATTCSVLGKLVLSDR